MAANSSLNLTSLDFDTLKNNFKTFLKSQDQFKDYNFDGSNINVLLDVMSYNTFLNSFYLNMVASEMFLDSAQKFDSVVSHAKELNYVPQSYSSSEANVNIIFETSGITNGKLTIPKNDTVFTGTNSNGSFTFVTDTTYTFTSSNNTYYANGIVLYEGSYTQDSFVVDYTVDNQRFIISNENIDTNSLTINVIEDNGISNNLFTHAETLFGLGNTSNIYFIQGSGEGKYEILFGDGNFGRKPQNGAVIRAKYRVSSGPVADGITSFELSSTLDEINNGTVNVTTLTTVANSSGGSIPETIENIRFRAPRWYATQQRGVSNEDYKSLILAEFGTYIQDIAVFGGQEITPKQYGAVVVSIKPYNATALTDYLKSLIVTFMVDKSQMRLLMVDPNYLYLKVDSEVQYDKTKTDLYINGVENAVLQKILDYSFNNLEKFNNDFRYSNFVSTIDNAEQSIISNNTKVHIIKKLSPLLNYATTYSFSFNNAANIELSNPAVGYVKNTAFSDEPVLTSTPFTYVNNGIEYSSAYIRDDNLGNLVVYTYQNSIFTILNNNIGTIDYETGEVTINGLLTSYYNQYIYIMLEPKNKDIIVNKNTILLIDSRDITIDMVDKLS